MAEIARHYRLFDDAKGRDRRSCAQILVVSDEVSCAYVVYDGMWEDRNLLPVNLHDPQPTLCRIGAPHDSILTDDLALADMDRYRLVIFLNPYHLTDRQRHLIRDRVLGGGRTVVWCYAPGLFSGARATPEAMAALTGIRMSLPGGQEKIAPQIELRETTHPLGRELRARGLTIVGHDRKCCQLPLIRDPEALILGALPGTAEPTFVVKDQKGWRSVYVITAKLPPAFFRALARYAGVHIYDEADDALYASRSYLTVSADHEGERTIRFPRAVDVFDPFTGQRLYENVAQFPLHLADKETRIFRYE